MRQILATGTLVPQRFRTFLFRGERYVTHHMAAGQMYFSTLAEWDGFSRGVRLRY